MKKLFLTSLILFFYFTGFSQQIYPLLVEKDQLNQKKWVDSIYNAMTLEEKVGQLFMVDVFSSDPKSKNNKIDSLIKNQHIGGIIFSKGGPKRQAKLNNHYQDISKIPLIMAMDAEWGLAMRLDSTFAYPWNMTLGAITNNEIIYKIGKQIGEHTKRIGMHINFSPVVDINTNPNNPIIGNRSFGEDRDNVTEKALAFMRGIQSVGILANAKHFPGHGDTEKDSHKTLPTISFSKNRLDSIELYPYKRLIEAGLSSIMIAHLNVPSLEIRANFPSSLSKGIVTNLLQKEMEFNGLVFTDALNMKGASNFKEPGEIDLAAFLSMISNKTKFVTDKLPVNFKWIGLIKRLYPDAKIIHVIRDPMDTCLSNYRNYFTATGNAYAYNQEELARFFLDYRNLMDFWYNMFPNQIYACDYNFLTLNQEAETRSLLNYCDLNWESQVLKFEANKRVVKTASVAQVREGIYQTSIGGWEHYKNHLISLHSVLQEGDAFRQWDKTKFA